MSQHTHGHAPADGSTHAHAPTDSSTHGHAHGPVPWYGRILETLGFGHTHDSADRVDTALESSARGIRAVKTSLVGLGVTARAIAERARHNPLHSVPRLGQVAVHVDPCEHDGSDHHAETAHHFSDAVAVRHASLTEPAHVPAGAVHARYLDLGQRSTNLRTRAEDWRAGEPVGRTVCLELTDFIGVLVAPAAWPQPLAGPVREIARSIVPLRAALQRDDAAAGAEPLAAIKEASHQLTHSLYEGWLPGAVASNEPGAVHSRYLDLIQRTTNLRTRGDDWRAAVPIARTVCLELTDFISVLVAPAAWPQPLAGPVREIAAGLVPLRAALQRDDAAAGAAPLAAIKEAAHQLTHALYERWLPASVAADERGAVHARYLDLGQRSTNLRTRAEDWRAGEPVGRTVCLELTDFIGVLVAPAAWPQPLAGPVREIARSIVPLRAALQRDDAAAGAEPLAAIKEASHQLTHSLYEGWLPGAAVTRSREAYSSIG